ncbi:MAG: hypothetical protein QM804_17180 [Propionicimonas sp.]
MLDFAQRFAAADPATTPLDAPLSDDALALLDRVMTPRAAQPAAKPPALPRPPRWQLPRLAIAIAIPALILATLAAMGWGWFGLFSRSTGELTATPAPGWAEPSAPAFASEQELVAASDAILVADTIGTGTLELNGLRHWLATVKVVSVGKGDFEPGEILQVTWPAPEDSGLWPAALEMGNRGLLFLTTPGAPGTSADLVDPLEGTYLIDDSYPDPIPEGGSSLDVGAGFLDRLGIRIP